MGYRIFTKENKIVIARSLKFIENNIKNLKESNEIKKTHKVTKTTLKYG